MFDLLTKEEDHVAAGQGWGLHYVHDQQLKKWRVQILPVTFAPPLASAESAMKHVINLARTQGQPLAVKALRLMAHGAQKK